MTTVRPDFGLIGHHRWVATERDDTAPLVPPIAPAVLCRVGRVGNDAEPFGNGTDPPGTVDRRTSGFVQNHAKRAVRWLGSETIGEDPDREDSLRLVVPP